MLSTTNLNSFLTLGYFLEFRNTEYIPIPITNPSLYSEIDERELIDIGSKIFLDIFNDEIITNKKHLVPLSGGYDSRAIIGALLKHTNASNIKTFTFGIPGSFDFEIGKELSKYLGIENLEIDLNKQEFSMKMLMNTAKRFNHQTFLFYHPDYDVIKEKFGQCIYWSGFLGGEAAGSHFPIWETEKMHINFIIEKFLKNNQYVKSKYLASEPLNSLIPLIDGQNITIENFSRYETIDFFNRQTKYIAPHVCPLGFNVIAPYSSKEWLNFICSVPNKNRHDVILYEKILLHTFPELFSFPTKNKYGLPLNSSTYRVLMKKLNYKIQRRLGFDEVINNKIRNYFDINSAVRNNDTIKHIMIENINDLTNRNILPWLNPNKILNDHLQSLNNYGDAIQVLASLEIILKSKDL